MGEEEEEGEEGEEEELERKEGGRDLGLERAANAEAAWAIT